VTEIEESLRLVIAAVVDAEDANPYFDDELALWLPDIRRMARAALARCRELRDIDELEAALP
jgi:hypothetical protein